MSLDDLTAAPTEFRAGGRFYRVGPFRYLERGILQRYVNEHARSPLDRAKADCAGLEPEERKAILAEARVRRDAWRPPVIGEVRGTPVVCPDCGKVVDQKPPAPSGGDDDWQDVLLRDPDGQRCFLRTLFLIHQPDFSEADLDAVLAAVPFRGDELQRLVQVGFDIRDDEDAGPKAP